MVVMFYSQTDGAQAWQQRLQQYLPELELRIWPELGALEQIDAALVWKPPAGLLASLPNLRLILSLGMGVDHIFHDPHLPSGVPITRMLDHDMARQMSQYVAHAILDHLRQMSAYRADQAAKRWQPRPLLDSSKTPVGILGYGVLGQACAHVLQVLGFPVRTWSRTPRPLEHAESTVEHFYGVEQLAEFASQAQVLVCLLPLTEETRGVLNAQLFAQLPRGAYVINSARGGHLVEEDLLAALASGQLSGAALDVMQHEPLAAEHLFWQHPAIRITPHIAALTNPDTAAAQVAENLYRLEAGLPLLNLVEPERGY